jgi:hypothetical protein
LGGTPVGATGFSLARMPGTGGESDSTPMVRRTDFPEVVSPCGYRTASDPIRHPLGCLFLIFPRPSRNNALGQVVVKGWADVSPVHADCVAIIGVELRTVLFAFTQLPDAVLDTRLAEQ